MDRRSFIKDCLLLCAAPAIVKIESIMPVKVIQPVSFLPNGGLNISSGTADFGPFSEEAIRNFYKESVVIYV